MVSLQKTKKKHSWVRIFLNQRGFLQCLARFGYTLYMRHLGTAAINLVDKYGSGEVCRLTGGYSVGAVRRRSGTPTGRRTNGTGVTSGFEVGQRYNNKTRHRSPLLFTWNQTEKYHAISRQSVKLRPVQNQLQNSASASASYTAWFETQDLTGESKFLILIKLSTKLFSPECKFLPCLPPPYFQILGLKNKISAAQDSLA